MKQVQPNPWDKVAERYPPGTDRHRRGPQPHQLRGLHRDRGRHRRPAARQRHELGAQGRPSLRGACNKGDKVTCVVLNVDQERKRDRPGPQADGQRPVGRRHSRPLPAAARSRRARSPSSPTSASSSNWSRAWKGLLHISELADQKVESPEDVVKVGDEIEVKILRVDAGRPQDRPEPQAARLDQGRGGSGGPTDAAADQAAAAKAAAKAPRELRGGTGGGCGKLFNMPESSEKSR